LCYTVNSFSLTRQSASTYSTIAGLGVGLVSAGFTYKLFLSANQEKQEADSDDLDEILKDISADLNSILEEDFKGENQASMLKQVLISLAVGGCAGIITKALVAEVLLIPIKRKENEEWKRFFSGGSFTINPGPSEAEKKANARKFLGVSDHATKGEIKKAYSKLSMKNHPDRVLLNNMSKEDATKKFQEINEAYQLLK